MDKRVFFCHTVDRECLYEPFPLLFEYGGTCLQVMNCQIGDSINQIIESVLTEVFGKKGALYIYRYIENAYQIAPSQFSKQLELFSKGLEDCLSTGAIPIQARILHAIGNLQSA
jgi:hypothetical protein